MSESWVKSTEQGTLLRVRVSPRAKASQVEGPYGDELKIRLKAPPVDGKANDELVRFLAAQLGCAKSQVRLTGGMTSRSKSLEISSLGPEQVAARLHPAGE